MNSSLIARTLRLGALLWAALALAALAVSPRAHLGVLAGGALGLGNFWVLGRLSAAVARAVARDGHGRAALLGVLLATKFLALAAAVWAALRLLPIDPIAFVAGISVFVIAVLGAAAAAALRGPAGAPAGGGR